MDVRVSHEDVRENNKVVLIFSGDKKKVYSKILLQYDAADIRKKRNEKKKLRKLNHERAQFVFVTQNMNIALITSVKVCLLSSNVICAWIRNKRKKEKDILSIYHLHA